MNLALLKQLLPAVFIGVVHVIYPISYTHGSKTLLFTHPSASMHFLWGACVFGWGYQWSTVQHGTFVDLNHILVLVSLIVWMVLHHEVKTKREALWTLLICFTLILCTVLQNQSCNYAMSAPLLALVVLALSRNITEVEEQYSILYAFRGTEVPATPNLAYM
jgi:hypothetical protein